MVTASMRFYLMGYRGQVLPRWLRRTLAKTSLHAAWLSGHLGGFVCDGRRFGVADRASTQLRKGVRTLTLWGVVVSLWRPHG